MSLRPRQTAPISEPQSLANYTPSPYKDRRHLGPDEYSDHDGGPWYVNSDAMRPIRYTRVPERWVISPELGSSVPALAVFPRRNSTKIQFSDNVALDFSAVWSVIPSEFSQLVLVDVDKIGRIAPINQDQGWTVRFHAKNCNGSTSMVIKVHVNNQGDSLLGYEILCTASDHVIRISDFPPPPSSSVGFDTASAIVVNAAFTTFDVANMSIVFSKLDESVEPERRIARATSAWELFVKDIKIRSAETVATIDDIRMSVFYNHFRGEKRNLNFWQVDPNRDVEV